MADKKEQIDESKQLADQAKRLTKEYQEQLALSNDIIGGTRLFKKLQDTTIQLKNKGNELNKKELGQMDKVLVKIKKRVKLTEERNNLTESYKNSLKNALGLNSDIVKMLKAGAIAALGLMVLTKVVGFLSNMVGSTIELQHEMGMSAGQAIVFQKNIIMAKASVDGILFSMDELTASAKAVSEATGRINVSPETITNVTELTKLLGDANQAVSLERSLKTAGINSEDLVKNVKEMAQGLGMDAGPAMEFLASNQLELQGMTEKQVLTRAREGLLMKQMGVDMKKAKQLASESLDIETSMKNEMKLRMITGKNINLNELRAAQASGDAFAVAQAQQNLVSTLGSDLENNLQVQRLISQATGMEADDLINMKNSQSEMNAEKEEEKNLQDQVNEKILEGFQTISNAATMIKDGLVGGLNAVKAAADIILMPFKFIYDTIMASNVALGTFAVTATLISGIKNRQLIADTAMLAVEKGKQVFQSASLVKETALKALKSKTLLSDIGGMAMAAFKSAAAVPVIGPILGAAAAATALGLGYSYYSKAGDVMSPADGKTRISTKEGGLLELSKNDDVVAAPGLLGGNKGSGNGGGMNLSALINEIKGLRRDIQSQPIMINVDGKVVSAISRVQKRQNSTSTAGYGR